MSATERLRAMLDERGADYRVSATGYSIDIGPYTTAYANRSDTTLDVSLRQVTPEQAIEATLGRGECEVEESWHGESEMVEYHCTACDEYMAVEVVKPNGAQPPNFCPNCGRKVKA